MVFEKISIHKRDLETRVNSINKSWKIPQIEKEGVIEFIKDYQIGLVNQGKKIGDSRALKICDMIKISLEYFNKPCEKITLEDMKEFERGLTCGKIRKKHKSKKENYSFSTQISIKQTLKVYLKHRLGETPQYHKLTDWLDLRQPKNHTPDYLNETAVMKLYKTCDNAENRFLIAVLFDSGVRAEEFHNIRYEDIELPKGNNNFVKVTIKGEYSKTQGRVISLYWEKSTEAVIDYIKEREREGIKSNEPIFANSYDNSRQTLSRLGKKVLGKNVHYHLFRHSSATYYASKLNRQQLCYRYGWKFSSDMVDIYISRSGMLNNELDEKFEATEIGELKRLLEQEKINTKINQERTEEELKKAMKLLEIYIRSIPEEEKKKRGKLLVKIEEMPLLKEYNLIE